ncbi:MAG: MerC domain-containing protein [Idiomarina sp.]|nr:MerC domain-containing protein [Idiomarina sp.]
MRHKPLDRAGIILAVTCALHCLLVPVVLPMLTLVGLSFLGYEIFERIILSASLLLGGVAITLGFRHHSSPLPLLALIAGGTLYFFKDVAGHAWEPLFVVIGAALIVTAHTFNLYLCRSRNSKPCEEVEDALHEQSEEVATPPSARIP